MIDMESIAGPSKLTYGKVCIITVYFGKLPNTFPLWMKSAQCNKTVDFLVVTDQNVDCAAPNIRIVNMSFDHCRKLIALKLDMEVCITRPYKLCDFKPVYGVIFNDYLTAYDYWGHCDLDMVFGNLINFFEEYELWKYDKFLSEGHLALYRNSSVCNNYYKLKGSYYGYEQVFSDERNFVYDEGNKINGIYAYNGFPLFNKRVYANINPSLKRFQCCRLKNYPYQVFAYEEGEIVRYYLYRGEVKSEKFMYIHLLKRRMPDITQELLNADGIYITEHGYTLQKKSDELCCKIKELSCYEGVWKDTWAKIKNEYHFNWTMQSMKRRLSIFLFRFRLGRIILKKDF